MLINNLFKFYTNLQSLNHYHISFLDDVTRGVNQLILIKGDYFDIKIIKNKEIFS